MTERITASPELHRVLREQDRATVRMLIRIKPDGPKDAERIAATIEMLLKRTQET